MSAFFQLLSVLAFHIIHPFYISMTDINYNNTNKVVEVSVRIFTDDFEKTLRKNCNCKVDLLAPKDKKVMEKLVSTYVLKHLQIRLDGQLRNLEFAGYQQEEESVWSYFLIGNVNQLKKIEINNTLLHDYREEQINMVHIQANGKNFTDKLDYPEKLYSVNL
jgi:hypothetical protein